MSTPPPRSATPRPPRQSPSAFYLHSRDSDDDFYGVRNGHPLAPPNNEHSESTANRLSASDQSHPSNVFADPASTSGHSSAAAYAPVPDPFRFPLSFRPSNSFSPPPATHPSFPQNPLSPRQRGVPPSAYVERADSPGPISRITQAAADEEFIPPDRPFARPTMSPRITEGSRNSSAGSFAPAPQPWINLASRLSIVGSTAANGNDQPVRIRVKKKPSFTSTILKTPIEKPWLATHDRWSTVGQWITRLIFLLGVCAAGAICFLGVSTIPKLGNVCLVLDDEFDSLDTNTWQREVAVGDFGNGEFQWYTANDNNSFVQNGKLYIVPTLTSDSIGQDAVFNGGAIDLGDACTAVNSSGCTAVGDTSAGTVINPVQSARLTTRLSHAIQYGRVEVRAKMPRGDWLWPAIWMLPSNDTYGQWPMSGEIDIAESRGNGMDYSAQGSNFVSSALHWGPTTTIDAWTKTWGWIQQRRASYTDGFHTYAVEWSPEFMRFYTDAKTVSPLQLNFNKKSLFDQGKFPQIITQGVNQDILKNPWEGRGNNAPFDQPFYLILNVAVGGTNGWFPNGVGDKPWVDQSATAMRDFAAQQDKWSKTWPQNVFQRAMVVDWVKMWRTC